MPPDLVNLSRNFASGRYEIAENGVLYTMELEHTVMLKSWWKSNPTPTLADWYKSLDRAARKKIFKFGEEPGDSDFFSDPTYD